MNIYEEVEDEVEDGEYSFFPLQSSYYGESDPIDLFSLLLTQLEGEIL